MRQCSLWDSRPLNTFCLSLLCCSIQHFVANAGDYAVQMVDNLLDILTQGQHSNTIKMLKEVSKIHTEACSSVVVVLKVVGKTDKLACRSI